MDTCNDCLKRDICTKICPEIEIILSEQSHSIKAYRVLYYSLNDLEKYFAVISRNEIVETDAVRQLKRLLRKFFRRLTKRQKKCVSLYYGMFGNNACSQTEIAFMLKIKPHTVNEHIFNAKRNLKKWVEKYQNHR